MWCFWNPNLNLHTMIRSGASLLSSATRILTSPGTKQVLTSPTVTTLLRRRPASSSLNPSLFNAQINKPFSTNTKYTNNNVAACEEEQKPPPIATGFTFEAGVSVIPHPEKVYKGGEDAYFISDDNKVLGVADGVGGWSKHGVDPALYSKALMEGAKQGTKDSEINRDPVKIMRKGYRSKEQQHSFNFPFQLGGKTSQSKDVPEHSDKESIKIASGDIVILGTDGLWDNLYDEQIVQLAKKTTDPNKLAKLIGQTASEFANKRDGSSPFSDGAYKAGKGRRPGGKLDDITVLVGRIRAGSLKSSDDEDNNIIFGAVGKLWAKL